MNYRYSNTLAAAVMREIERNCENERQHNTLTLYGIEIKPLIMEGYAYKSHFERIGGDAIKHVETAKRDSVCMSLLTTATETRKMRAHLNSERIQRLADAAAQRQTLLNYD